MMASLVSFESPPVDYPNHLAGPTPERSQFRPAGWLLLWLLVLCLLPRLVMVFRVPVICIDGPVYVNYAKALEAGHYRSALMDGAVNLYPIVLMFLHRLGLGWETAGAVWGVTLSCLVVLPLWGWVRRQFDDRVALTACLLYIVHPKFILESPEVTRDPTFWLFFITSIYLMWRAVTEVRYRYFLGVGVTITLAVLTRVEGITLVIPLVLWTFWRFLALRTDRKKLLIGAVFCVGAFPVLLLAVNLAAFHDDLGMAMVRVSPLERIQPWVESLFGLEAGNAVDRWDPTMTFGRMLWIFFPTMTRGLAPLFALLMFGGIWGWRRIWIRRDNQALFCTAMVIVFGIWVQLWYDGNISRRYPLPIMLMASPFAALALLALIVRARQVIGRLGWRTVRGQQAAAVATVAIFVVGGIGHAMKSSDEPRRITADVSRWVRHDFVQPPVIVGPSFMERIVEYYAEPRDYVSIPVGADDAAILTLVSQQKPDLVILWPTKRLTTEHCKSLIDQMKPCGLKPVHPTAVHEAADRFYMLVRTDKTQCAQMSTRER